MTKHTNPTTVTVAVHARQGLMISPGVAYSEHKEKLKGYDIFMEIREG